MRTIRLITLTALAVGALVGLTPTASAATDAFYVDCSGGSNSAAGTSPGTAWRTLNRANSAELGAGDTLHLKRGCTWTGQRLDVTWSGNSGAPVTVTNYGSGSLPLVKNGPNSGVKITGRHVVIDGLSVDFDVFETDPCGQPLGDYYGFNITAGASHVEVRNSIARHATAGLHISKTAGGNHTIISNRFERNNVMTKPFDGSGDLGAWGILLRGDDNEIAFNHFENNVAVCMKGKQRFHGNSVELYEARNNHIHHNTAVGDRVFSELGSSSDQVASGNRYTFNTHVTDLVDARFITTRGAGDLQFGPVRGTVAERNSIRYTGAGSQGIICALGCTPNIMSASYNIIHVVEKTIFFDGSMTQRDNLLWSPGPVMIQEAGQLVELDAGTTNSRYTVADPQFVSATDLRLRPSSPAIDNGVDIGGPVDAFGGPSRVGPRSDLGADEFDPVVQFSPSRCTASQPTTAVSEIVRRSTATCTARRAQ